MIVECLQHCSKVAKGIEKLKKCQSYSQKQNDTIFLADSKILNIMQLSNTIQILLQLV